MKELWFPITVVVLLAAQLGVLMYREFWRDWLKETENIIAAIERMNQNVLDTVKQLKRLNDALR